MRNWVHFGIMVVALFCSASAYADTIYNVTLTPTTGGVGGSGTFSLNVAPPTLGQVTYSAGSQGSYLLNAFSISIGGNTFDLGTTSGATSVVFNNGMLSAISYGASIGSTALQLKKLGYGFIAVGNGAPPTTGTVSASAVVAVAPEPSSLLLLGSGILTMAGMMKRRAGAGFAVSRV